MTTLLPQEGYAKAKAFSEKALALDPDLPEALAVQGWVRCAYDWDCAGAERTLLRAVQLGPSSYPAHYWRGVTLTMLGRFDEAVDEGHRLLELNPAIPGSHVWLAWIYSCARRFDPAIAVLEKTRELYPTENDVDYMMCTTYAASGQNSLALAACDRAVARTGVRGYPAIGDHIVFDSGVAWAYAVAGRRSEALRILEIWKRRERETYVDPFAMAPIYAGLGEKERAFELLEKGISHRSPLMIGLKIEPALDGLRADPRYDQLMRRVGLPVS